MRFLDRKVLVTGSASGLGLVFATEFLKEGATVVLADIQAERLRATQEILADQFPGKVYSRPVDVSDIQSVNCLFKSIDTDIGTIDVLVNNAGGGLGTPLRLMEVTEGDWDIVLDINLKGTFFCCQEALKRMIRKEYGRIINVASIGARMASPVSGPQYAAAKGGIIAMTRRIAYEVGQYHITVNAIAPGTVLSGPRMESVWSSLTHNERTAILDAIPLHRISTAEDQAKGVLFLASEEASYITGLTLDINGGRFMG